MLLRKTNAGLKVFINVYVAVYMANIKMRTLYRLPVKPDLKMSRCGIESRTQYVCLSY